MNIFVLDENPKLSAEYHCDAHVSKMILECIQLLRSAHLILDGVDVAHKFSIVRGLNGHRCAQWVRACDKNYEWLWYLFAALLEQYERRYGRFHKFDSFNRRLYKLPEGITDSLERTPFVQCMPEIYKRDSSESVTAYREYYFFEKRSKAFWNKGVEAPYWWCEMEASQHYHHGEAHVGA